MSRSFIPIDSTGGTLAASGTGRRLTRVGGWSRLRRPPSCGSIDRGPTCTIDPAAGSDTASRSLPRRPGAITAGRRASLIARRHPRASTRGLPHEIQCALTSRPRDRREASRPGRRSSVAPLTLRGGEPAARPTAGPVTTEKHEALPSSREGTKMVPLHSPTSPVPICGMGRGGGLDHARRGRLWRPRRQQRHRRPVRRLRRLVPLELVGRLDGGHRRRPRIDRGSDRRRGGRNRRGTRRGGKCGGRLDRDRGNIRR